MRVLACVLAVAFVVALGSCQSAPATTSTSAPINANCVINTSKAVNAECYVEHNGQKIGFCCNNCKGKFEALSDAEKDACVDKLPNN